MRPFSLEEYLKNPERKVVTKDGLNARIICTDRKDSKYPIVALIETKSGKEVLHYYTKDGTYYIDNSCDADLLFLPEKHEGWINVYKMNSIVEYITSAVYNTKSEAEKYIIKGSTYSYVNTIKIEWEE